MTAFKQLVTPAITALIVKGASALLNSTQFKCRKVSYHSAAAAQKALKQHGYRIGCKAHYKCDRHGTLEVHHLTSMKTHKKRNKDMTPPSPQEVEVVAEWCRDAEENGESNYPGMTYEQGVLAALDWTAGYGENPSL